MNNFMSNWKKLKKGNAWLFLLISILCINILIPSKKIFANEVQRKSIISIDAGRKYISVNQFKKIIDNASDNGYSSVECILGNDGLRLILDDMSVMLENKVYSSDDVKKGIIQGNKEYYDDSNGSYLTQSEMDTIIAYAKSKSIEIIPVINSPGHMDALLTTMKTLGIKSPNFKTSSRTVDLNNDEAVLFTQNLVSKYVKYFSEYSKIFNFGFDEYANDVKEGGGWQSLQKTGEYKKFIQYANTMSKIAKQYNMSPMAFNDGIYYNNQTKFGLFDKDIIVSYWTSGWKGYNVASAEYLAKSGHKILNTNDSWYWVIGRMNSSDGYYNFQQALNGIKQNNFSQVSGSKGKIPIIGSMICIWADEPQKTLNLDDVFKLTSEFMKLNR